MLMIRGCFIIGVCCAVLALASRVEAVELVKNGVAVATIELPTQTEYEKYLPEHPDRAKQAAIVGDEELLAAEELQDILRKISGANLKIHRTNSSMNEADRSGSAKLPLAGAANILLGEALARQAGLGAELDRLDKDGFLCAVRGNRLILSGRRARGTLYAAYAFLESLGCRWVMPGDFGALYPSLKKIKTNIAITQNPSHSQRYWWCTYGNTPEYTRWTLRTKGNFVQALGDEIVAQGHALGAPLDWGRTQPQYAVKNEKGEAVLPDEYFALQNGKPAMHTPNFSNPKTWQLYADYYIDYFKQHPNLNYVSISAEDGLVIDERPESRRLSSNDYDWTMGAMSASDMLWFFHNRVIEKVVKVFPGKKFTVLVYANNLMPPRIEHMNPHMALVFAPLGIDPTQAVQDVKSRTNAAYKTWLESWMKQAKGAGAETYYYDYEPMGYCWNMAMICPRWGIIGKNYPYFKKLGLDGYTTQGYDDWASCGLDNYLMQRLFWNINLNYKDVIADYAKARFGAAAPAMVQYYSLLEKRMDEIPTLYSNEVWANHMILTPEIRNQARGILARAVKMADSERARQQLATMVELQRSTDAACDAVEYADATGDFGKAARMMDPIWASRDKLNELYPNFMNKVRLNDKETSQYMTGGIYNQYLGFDKTIRASHASVLLPRLWKGMLDTDNTAWSSGLYRPEVSVSGLDDLDVTVCPDVKYKTQRRVAAFFYRTEAEIPTSFADRKVVLYFPSVIAKGLQIWVNGQPVSFPEKDYVDTTWRGPDYFWIDYDHEKEFDITPYVKAGARNTIAFRVFKSFDFGGSYRRVYLLAR